MDLTEGPRRGIGRQGVHELLGVGAYRQPPAGASSSGRGRGSGWAGSQLGSGTDVRPALRLPEDKVSDARGDNDDLGDQVGDIDPEAVHRVGTRNQGRTLQ